MSLKAILEETAAGSVNRFPPEVIAVMQQAAKDLDAQGVGEEALAAGDRLPDAILLGATGARVAIGDLLANGPLILTFYRGGWCPYCNLELKAYQDILGDIQAAGGQLVAITPEKPDNSLSTVEKNELSFEVLTDIGNTFAKALGIAFELPTELQKLYGQFGMDLPGINAETGWALPIPATFVVGPDGKIIHAYVERDYTKRMEPNAALEALKSISAPA